jgi:hypothetical protein
VEYVVPTVPPVKGLAVVMAGPGITVSEVVLLDVAKSESPEYVAVTVSGLPKGAFDAAQLPAPAVSDVMVHRVVVPTLKVTVPVGVPPEEVTVTE